MNVLKIIMTALLFVSYSSISKADTVIISYSDGKNQTVTLDSPVKSITSVQYIPSSMDNFAVPQSETAVSPQMHEAKQPLPQKDSAKPKIRFKWADPIVGQ
jgi:hypothetical protein